MALYTGNKRPSNMNPCITSTLVAVLALVANGMAGVVPAAAPLVAAPAPVATAPLVAAPAAVGYAKAVPYNIPPYASRVDLSTRTLSAPLIAAAPAAQFVAAAPAAQFVAAAPAAPVVAAAPSAPIVAAPGVGYAAYAGSLAAPFANAAYATYGPAVFG